MIEELAGMAYFAYYQHITSIIEREGFACMRRKHAMHKQQKYYRESKSGGSISQCHYVLPIV
jgi:hypothetical protein